MKGEIMTARRYFLVMALLVGPWSDRAIAQTKAIPAEPEALLIAGHEVLAGIEQLCTVMAAHETQLAGQLVDVPRLRAQVIERLEKAGITHIECKTGLTPRLAVSIEAIAVADCGQCVYRVQTSLNRVVTFSNHRDLSVQAEVWRLRPTLKVVAQDQASEALTASVLTQVEAFIGAYQAALRLRPRSGDAEGGTSAAGTVSQQGLEGTADGSITSYSFVASRSSAVFHRPDCRWVQRISERNLVGYATRDEAIEAGKRPCKSCKP
jgi:hypothetical protein